MACARGCRSYPFSRLHIGAVKTSDRAKRTVIRVNRSKMGDEDPFECPGEANTYKDYRWIVADPQLLGGKLAIRGKHGYIEAGREALNK